MPKLYDYEIVLAKTQKYCAYQERCQWDVEQKFREWEVDEEIRDDVLSDLITQGFIHEQRFALHYAGGHFRTKHWGKIKIESELKFRQVSKYSIIKALENISDEEYRLTLHNLIEKKISEVQAKNTFERNQKIAQYLYAKGYESELIWKELEIFTNE
ncbi:MAG TPA: RecX family transcriptional regulator [Bacteroidales bacterium]|nr:RecX family transcriptional regulator [Bacteroidales bacterium]